MSVDSFTPEGIWSRVDAARVAMDSATTERDAETVRLSLALVLADAAADGDDVVAMVAEYAQARAAHAYAQITATESRNELRVMRGIVSWPAVEQSA